MLENLLKKINEYVDAHKSLDKELHDQDETNRAWYNDSKRFEKLAALKKVHYDYCKLLNEKYKNEVINIFEEAFKQIRAVPMIPIDQGMFNNFSWIEKMSSISKEEVKSLYEATKNNYLANKKVYDFLMAKGNHEDALMKYLNYLQDKDVSEMFFISVDSMISCVEELKDYIMNNIFANSNMDFSNIGYHTANVLNGEYIHDVKRQGDIFITRYQK